MRWACWRRDGPPDHRHMLGAKGVARADAEAGRRHAAAIHAIAETVRVVCPWAANRARFACRRFNHVPYIRGHVAYTMLWVGRAGRIGACCCRRSSSFASPTDWTSCARQVRVHSSGSSNTCVHIAYSTQNAEYKIQHAAYNMQQTTCNREHAAYGIRIICCTTDSMQACNVYDTSYSVHHAAYDMPHAACKHTAFQDCAHASLPASRRAVSAHSAHHRRALPHDKYRTDDARALGGALQAAAH